MIGTVAGIVVLMLGLAAAVTAIDRHSALRSDAGPGGSTTPNCGAQ